MFATCLESLGCLSSGRIDPRSSLLNLLSQTSALNKNLSKSELDCDTESLISIYSCAQSLMKTACEINGTVQSFLPLCVQCAIKLRARLSETFILDNPELWEEDMNLDPIHLISVLHSLDFQGSTTSRSGSGQCSLINFTWEFLSHQ